MGLSYDNIANALITKYNQTNRVSDSIFVQDLKTIWITYNVKYLKSSCSIVYTFITMKRYIEESIGFLINYGL